MATIVSKQIRFDNTNAESYFSCPLKNCLGRDDNLAFVYLNDTKDTTITMNDSGKAQLYPTTTAKPCKADLHMRYRRTLGGTAKFTFYIDGTSVQHCESSSNSYVTTDNTGLTTSAIINSTRSSSITFYLWQDRTTRGAALLWENITFYFNQYSCTATKGTGISSASVSNSAPYQGDSVTFTCTVRSGYKWDGWYNGSTRVSTDQTYTCNGADLTLEARATESQSKIFFKEDGAWKRVTAYVKENGVWKVTETMPNNGWTAGDQILRIHCPWNLNYTLQHSADLVSSDGWAVSDYISVTPGVELIVQGMGSTATNTMWLDYTSDKTYHDYWGGSGTSTTLPDGKTLYTRTLSASNMTNVYFIRVNIYMNDISYCKVWQNNVLLFDGSHYPIN